MTIGHGSKTFYARRKGPESVTENLLVQSTLPYLYDDRYCRRKILQNGLPPQLNFQGQSQNLAHLAPFTHNLSGHGPKGRDLIVRVKFESHVFSDSIGSGPHDFLDERGSKRYFCTTRYAFSHCLPNEVRAILDRNVYTWQETDRNQVANLAVITPAGAPLASGVHNIIVYYLFPSKLDNVDVEFLVKTCYEKHLNFEHRKKREKIRVHVKTVCYKQIKIPRG